jgi:hypothetical protein
LHPTNAGIWVASRNLARVCFNAFRFRTQALAHFTHLAAGARIIITARRVGDSFVNTPWVGFTCIKGTGVVVFAGDQFTFAPPVRTAFFSGAEISVITGQFAIHRGMDAAFLTFSTGIFCARVAVVAVQRHTDTHTIRCAKIILGARIAIVTGRIGVTGHLRPVGPFHLLALVIAWRGHLARSFAAHR